jgi:hypothetical protein
MISSEWQSLREMLLYRIVQYRCVQEKSMSRIIQEEPELGTFQSGTD